jgi:hypothetical protein
MALYFLKHRDKFTFTSTYHLCLGLRGCLFPRLFAMFCSVFLRWRGSLANWTSSTLDDLPLSASGTHWQFPWIFGVPCCADKGPSQFIYTCTQWANWQEWQHFWRIPEVAGSKLDQNTIRDLPHPLQANAATVPRNRQRLSLPQSLTSFDAK